MPAEKLIRGLFGLGVKTDMISSVLRSAALRFLEYGLWCRFFSTDKSSCCHAETAWLSSIPYSSAVHIWLTVKAMASFSSSSVAPVQRHRDTFMQWSW